MARGKGAAMSELRHTPGVRVKYSATMVDTKSSVSIECDEIAVPLNHMIVWILNNQSEALALLPYFHRLNSVCAEDLNDWVKR